MHNNSKPHLFFLLFEIRSIIKTIANNKISLRVIHNLDNIEINEETAALNNIESVKITTPSLTPSPAGAKTATAPIIAAMENAPVTKK